MSCGRENSAGSFSINEAETGAGDPIACSRSGRYQFATRIVDDHIICLVGDEPRAALEDLLKTVRHAGG
jgi:hypothetical protein